MVICLELGADLHMAQLMPLTVSCFSRIQIGLTFLVLAHPEKRLLNGCIITGLHSLYAVEEYSTLQNVTLSASRSSDIIHGLSACVGLANWHDVQN